MTSPVRDSDFLIQLFDMQTPLLSISKGDALHALWGAEGDAIGQSRTILRMKKPGDKAGTVAGLKCRGERK
jgi:hypothetical protein